MTKISDKERRLGVRIIQPPPGDGRDLPGDAFRGPTPYEKRLATPPQDNRERRALGVDYDDDPRAKKLADVLIVRERRNSKP